jgi:hypothetical protein
MGWTTTDKRRGQTMQSFFQEELGDGIEIIKSAYKGFVFYAACRHRSKPDEVWALVVLTNRGDRYHNFGFKTLDETMGPNEVKCPADILDLLSPTNNAYALNWRKRCRETLEQQERAKRVKPGTVIEFDRLLTFGQWGKHKRFRFVGRLNDGIGGFKRDIWVIDDDSDYQGCYVKLGAWRTGNDWEIVEE